MNEKLPVTVVIPVLNEELNLPACLASLGTAFADVVVVDSGSSDRTCPIAEEAGARVLQFRWNGQFPKKRNWTLSHYAFRTLWVLFLDADERVTPEFVDELRKILPETLHAGFSVTLNNHFMGRRLRHGDPFRKRALFRIGAGEYEQFPENGWSSLDMEVHEHPVLAGSTGAIRARLEHHDFRSLEHYIRKHQEYARWEARRFCWLKSAAGRDAQLTCRQRIKYGLADKPGLGFLYFCAAYFLRLGFLDGAAGFRFNRLKWRYFNQVRSEIRQRLSK